MFNDFGTCPSAHSANGKISTQLEKIYFARDNTLQICNKNFLARGFIFFFMCILTYLFS